MLSEEFSASVEELQLSTRLLELNNWHKTDTLSVDAAIGIFKQSGLTFKQLRDIWTIADKKGSGSLSKHELAMVIRLMGWVQAGQPLHEDLLASAGPMPFIKGITDSISGSSSRPAIDVQIPPINPMDIYHFELAFNGANPVLGILNRQQVMMTLLRNNLSYNSVQKIIELVGESQKIFDFPKFVLALHLGDLLQTSKITSLPSAIPQYLQDQVAHFETPNLSPPLPPSSSRPSSFPASPPTLTPKDPPVEPDEGDLPQASRKLEFSLPLARSPIEFEPPSYRTVIPSPSCPIDEISADPPRNSSQNGSWSPPFPVMKLDSRALPVSLPLSDPCAPSSSNVSNHNPNPSDAILLTSPTPPTNEPLNTAALEEIRMEISNLSLRIERLRQNAVEQDASDPPSYQASTPSLLYPIDEISTDPPRNSSQDGPWSPPFSVMRPDSRASPVSLPLYNPYVPSSSNVSNHNPNPSDAILFTSPTPSTNEPLSTTALEEIKAETVNLLRRVEGNFIRKSIQRNRLQFTNEMLHDENLSLQSKIQDLETKLSEYILPSEHWRLQYEHTQEVGHLATDLRQTKELLASLRAQHGAQETVLHESHIEIEQLRRSVDAQVSDIANLRIQLAEKEKNIADSISKMDKPDMHLLYVRASLRESEASLSKVQDENENLRQVITLQRKEIPNLPARSTAEPTPSSVADESLVQNLGRLSSQVKEVQQMMEQFISSSQSRSTDPMAQYRDNMDARCSVETIRTSCGSRPDPPINGGFCEPPATPGSQRLTPPVQNISISTTFPPGNLIIHPSQQTEMNSFPHSSSSAGGGSVERYPFSDLHSPSNKSAPGFDVVAAFGQSLQTSQATGIEPFPHEHMDNLDLPAPFLSQDMEHLEDAELQEIKAEGTKLLSQMERCLQHQIIAQTNARASVLSDPSPIAYASLISERDAERRRHQVEISFLTEKLRDKEAECESLKTQNPISGLPVEVQEADDYDDQEITSSNRNRTYVRKFKKNIQGLQSFRKFLTEGIL